VLAGCLPDRQQSSTRAQFLTPHCRRSGKAFVSKNHDVVAHNRAAAEVSAIKVCSLPPFDSAASALPLPGVQTSRRPSLTVLSTFAPHVQVHTIIEDRDFADTDLEGFLEHSYQVSSWISSPWCRLCSPRSTAERERN